MPKSRKSSHDDNDVGVISTNKSRNPSANDDDDKQGIHLIGCRYDIILRVAMECNFKIVGESENWVMCWSDLPLLPDKISEMKRKKYLGGPNSPTIQKFNHFPAMYEICRKDRLGRNLNRFRRVFPNDFNFYPLTWDLPSDFGELMEYGRKHRNTIFIIKPDAGCQGKGIFLLKDIKLLCRFSKCVCQLYVTKPLLVDGFKFDQRIYVLVTCVDPLRIYIYRDGIARFATVKYETPCDANLEVTYMHLTNYSLNKFSDDFDSDITGGTKRPMSEVYSYMQDLGYDVQKLQSDVDDIVVKTIVMVAPSLRHNYRATFSKRDKGCFCYELLGFDILVDRHLTPILIEVNSSPSFNLDTPVDHYIKHALIADLFNMLHFGEKDHHPPPPGYQKDNKFNITRRPGTAFASTIPDALKDQFVHEEKSKNNFRLIFTEEHPGKYAKLLDEEYFLMEEEDEEEEDRLFYKKKYKKKAEAMYNQGCSESFNEIARMTAMSPPESDHNLFHMNNLHQFKYNFAHFTERTKPSLNVMRTRSRLRSGMSRNLTKASSSTPPPPLLEIVDIGKPPLPPEKLKPILEQEEPETEAGSCSSSSTLVVQLSPTQRVQNALEQLRKKNLEKFKSITEQNKDILSKYSSPSGTDLTSPLKKSAGCSNSNDAAINPGNSEFHYATQLQLEVSAGNKKSVKFKELRTNNKNRNILTLTNKSGRPSVPSFQPMPMDMTEERKRIRALTARKRALAVFGIHETIQQVVDDVAATTHSQFDDDDEYETQE